MFFTKSRHLVSFVAIIAFATAVAACTTPATPEASPAPPPTLAPSATPTEPPPSATPTAPPPTSTVAPVLGTASYADISFAYDTALVSGWQPADVPLDTGADMGIEFYYTPAHVALTATGYPIDNLYQKPRILVFPVQAWRGHNSLAEQRIAALQKLLVDRPTTFGPRDEIPVLPVFEAIQVFRSHVRYLDFKNGSGVRFMTQYDQAYIPINNQEVFYTFQGLTADKVWYVAAFFPISHPGLAADDTFDPALIDAAFDAYLVRTTTMLDAAPDGAFTPPLTTLDAMMQSLKVKR